MTDEEHDEGGRDLRDLTLSEALTSARLFVVIGVLVVIAFAVVTVRLVIGGDSDTPSPSGRCQSTGAYECEDFLEPKGGG